MRVGAVGRGIRGFGARFDANARTDDACARSRSVRLFRFVVSSRTRAKSRVASIARGRRSPIIIDPRPRAIARRASQALGGCARGGEAARRWTTTTVDDDERRGGVDGRDARRAVVVVRRARSSSVDGRSNGSKRSVGRRRDKTIGFRDGGGRERRERERRGGVVNESERWMRWCRPSVDGWGDATMCDSTRDVDD